MGNKKIIQQLYKSLLLYEDVIEGTLSEENYQRYLDRLAVYWLGRGDEDFYAQLQGLKILGGKAEKQTVKSCIFGQIEKLGGGE